MEKKKNQTKVPEYEPYPDGEIYPSLEGVDRAMNSSDYRELRTDITYRSDGIIEVSPQSLNIAGYTYLRPKMKEEELSNLVSDGNIRPDYYNYAIEPVEYIHKNKLDFFQGNVVKYITRFREKNGLEDLRKAKTYIDLLIEKEYGKESNPCENGCKGCEKEQCCKKTCKADV